MTSIDAMAKPYLRASANCGLGDRVSEGLTSAYRSNNLARSIIFT